MLSCDSCTVSLGVEEYYSLGGWARGAAGLGGGEIQMLGCTFSPPVL